jgi:hypothetical protein
MMKKNKIALVIIVFVVGLSVLLYFLPINRLIGSLPFINQFYNNTTLEIVTKKGKARIWVGGKDYGETPTTVENLAEGTYLIELEKIEEGRSFYEKQAFQVELTRNTSARVDLEIGPDNILHGIILYYTTIRTSSQDGFLTVISNADDARVFLDGEFIKVSPITNLSLKENQYKIKVVASGYEDVEIPVLIRDNYALNLKTFHFPVPVTYDALENDALENNVIENTLEDDILEDEINE